MLAGEKKKLLMKNRMFTVAILAAGFLLSAASHATARGEPFPVPDVGSSGLLLGISVCGIALVRRYFRGRK